MGTSASWKEPNSTGIEYTAWVRFIFAERRNATAVASRSGSAPSGCGRAVIEPLRGQRQRGARGRAGGLGPEPLHDRGREAAPAPVAGGVGQGEQGLGHLTVGDEREESALTLSSPPGGEG